MNVLHAPCNVGSQASSLSAAENAVRRQTGVAGRSWSADFLPSAVVSAADYTRDLRKTAGTLPGKIAAGFAPFLYGLRRIRQFGLLHLYFGRSLLLVEGRIPLLDHADLPLWKLARKRIFATFQGCDVRIRSIAAQEPVSACRAGVCDVPTCNHALDARRRRTIAKFSHHADKLFCLNPDLLEFVPNAEFLPYANLDLTLLDRGRVLSSATTPSVVHAPTSRAIKGTCHVESASRALRETHPHQLEFVEDIPRARAVEIYARADVLIDQLLVGWYGGLAVEAMALGLPVIAWLNPKHLARIPSLMRAELPIVSAVPDTLAAVLADLLANPAKRRALGEQGRAFVGRWHHPQKIARAMLYLYGHPSRRFWDVYERE